MLTHNLPDRSRARRNTRFRLARLFIVSLLAAAALKPADVHAQPGVQIRIQGPIRRSAGDETSIAGVYLPTDRALSRAVARARERLANHEYQESLSFLQGVLARDEDAFLEGASGEREQHGLKQTVRRMVGELP